MMPAPLMFAVKIAAMTCRLKIMTSIVLLPLHDMRTVAGEIVVADIFTLVLHNISSPGPYRAVYKA